MISRDRDPVSFSSFVDELADAEGHLHDLIEKVMNEPDYDETDFRVDLGHVFAHLNRAWHTRNSKDGDADADRGIVSAFPTDLTPVG